MTHKYFITTPQSFVLGCTLPVQNFRLSRTLSVPLQYTSEDFRTPCKLFALI